MTWTDDNWMSRYTGELAFDIGANGGPAALIFAPRFSRVISIEPCTENEPALKRLAEQYPNITPLMCAVSDHDGTVDLAVQSGPISSFQLTSGQGVWGGVSGHRTVPCRTIDSLAGEFGDPDLIKVDTEGHDLLVLKGGLDTIRRVKPAMNVEVHEDTQGEEIHAILSDIYGHVVKLENPSIGPGAHLYGHWYWLMAGHEEDGDGSLRAAGRGVPA